MFPWQFSSGCSRSSCSDTMIFAVLVLQFISSWAQAVDGNGACHFDGRGYSLGDTIMIQPCLASMQCVGPEVYGNMKQLGGVCPDSKRDVDGQTGCLFDGRVYGKGDKIVIQPCLAMMTCEGNNVYSEVTSLGGECPKETRDVNGQTGCLFDGRVYAEGDTLTIQPCLAKMTCLGHNSYSDITMLNGQC